MDSSHFTIFYSYAHEDEELRDKLETHLAPLKQQKYITSWHDRRIPLGGLPAQQVIDEQLMAAHIILLLISADFLASDYCYGIEMPKALSRHRNGDAYVIPVLLRPVDWQGAPFEDLRYLPRDGRPITVWENVDVAFYDVATGIRIVLEHLQDALDTRPLPLLPAWPPMPPLRKLPPALISRKRREHLLKHVRTLWITGILEKSLNRTVRIPLRLREQPDAVENPWELAVQESNMPSRLLPVGTRIMQLYAEADGKLLILGEPGAGKTTLLLELARDLLICAEDDVNHWIPVVFTLSSWADKRQTLSDWLIEELHHKYGVPRKTAASWINEDQILPLLDGLDEVDEQQRLACVHAINTYKQEHDIVPLVVSSRYAEYLALNTRFMLRKAVLIEPLTMQQVEVYFQRVKKDVESVRAAVHKEAILQELVKTPLMLDVITNAYENAPIENIANITSLEGIRQQVFSAYVECVLARRQASTYYKDRQQVKDWLSWLAQRMMASRQTEFYMERMQPAWLPETQRRHLNRIVILLFKLIVIVGAGIEGMRSFGPFGGLAYALVGGYLAKSELVEGAIVPAETIQWPWKNMGNVRFVDSLFSGLTIGLRAVLFIFVLSFISVCLFLVRGSGPLFGSDISLSFLLAAAFVITVGSAMLFLLQSGWSSQIFDDRRGMSPNQGIWLSGRNSIIAGLIFGLVSGLTFSFTIGPVDGVICGLTIGLVMGLFNGGVACIKHVILRYQLFRAGSIPWNYQHFLDYAADHILLYKRGNGYIFIHKLLLEYFANRKRQ
jgi:hypothetical protein